VPQPALELRQDGIARVPAHTDDEGKAELRLVRVVQPVEARELLFAQAVQADARLLAPGLIGHRARSGRLAGKVGMAMQELDLPFARGGPHRAHHGLVQGGYRLERTPRRRAFSDPRRQFKGIADGGCEIPRVHPVQRVERKRHAGHLAWPGGRLYSPVMK
jgi:hypothetical protein